MKRKKILLAALVALCLVLTGCSSSLSDNSGIYLSQMGQKMDIWLNSANAPAPQPSGASDPGTADDGKTALATPGNWSVADDGSYSFDAVDGAGYYIVYLYDTQSEDTSFAYMSQNIDEDGSGSYSGKLADLFDYCYGLYDAEIVAYPAVGVKDVKKSAASTCGFSVIGEVPAPQVAYLWDCFTGTLGMELINIEDYGASSFPTSMEVTFTNQADSSDVITMSLENLSVLEDIFYASTQDVTKDATYTVSASLTWDSSIVTNDSITVDVGTVTTASDKNAMVDGYGYLDTSIYLSMDFPMVVTDFDPVKGGSAGTWYFYVNAFMTNKGVAIPSTFRDCLSFQGEKGSMGGAYHDGEDVYFTVTPMAANAGSAYSYTLDVRGERDVISMFDGFFWNDMSAASGSLELYTDGTFLMTISEPESSGGAGPGGGSRGINGSSIQGRWVENGDGTVTLSYDHTSTTGGGTGR